MSLLFPWRHTWVANFKRRLSVQWSRPLHLLLQLVDGREGISALQLRNIGVGDGSVEDSAASAMSLGDGEHLVESGGVDVECGGDAEGEGGDDEGTVRTMTRIPGIFSETGGVARAGRVRVVLGKCLATL